MNYTDISGQKFGLLTAISYLGHSRWLCECVCASTFESTYSHLKSGKTVSCGCRKLIHGCAHEPLYKTWIAMKARCVSPSCVAYKNYGGRGITVCDRWMKLFADFRDDMGSKPSSKHTLERLDNDLGYTPENCAWVTRSVQAQNKRSSIRLTHKGVETTINALSEEYGVNYRTLYTRLRKGMSVDEAVSRPIAPGKRVETPVSA